MLKSTWVSKNPPSPLWWKPTAMEGRINEEVLASQLADELLELSGEQCFVERLRCRPLLGDTRQLTFSPNM